MSDEATEERSVLSLIRDIQSGAVNGRSLDIEDRQRCVEHMTGEGYSVVEIAEVLKTSDRTIARDKAAIRAANSVERDPRLAAETVGYLMRQADLTVSHIRRTVRDKETPPGVKIEGERYCWLTVRELVDSLQRLGYLPTAATEIKGDLTHHVDGLPELAQMQEEVARLEEIMEHAGIDDRVIIEQVTGLHDTVARLALSDRIESAQQAITTSIASKDAPPHDNHP